MPLIKTIPEVKSNVKVDFPTGGTGSLPNMAKAERKFIVPILGEELYNKIQEQYDSDTLTEPNEKLLKKIQAALAPLAYWRELALINTRITDNGLRKTSTGDQQAVFKWDFLVVKAELEQSGMEELENLLLFLENNIVDFPDWTNSPAYSTYTRFIVKNGTEFNACYSLAFPRVCYLYFQPLIELVEDLYINKSIGGDFNGQLKMLKSPSEKEIEAIRLLRHATCNLTVLHAASRMGVKITTSGLTVLLSDTDQYNGNEQTATIAQIEALKTEVERIGQNYLLEAQDFLNQHASSTVFPTYFAGPFYRAPGRNEPSPNQDLKSIFFF